MNLKTVIPLVVALVLGVVAAKLGKDMLDKRKVAAGAGVPMTRMVVAGRDIPPGAVIAEADLAQGAAPAEGGPKGTFTNPADVVGRVAVTQLVKGQAVLDSLLAAKNTAGGVQALVPPGKRALTLEINESSGVAGLLTPGCRVDVVHTVRNKDAPGDSMIARTIVENLKVIAVGRRLTVAPTAPPVPKPGSPPGAPPAAEPEPPIARSVTVLATREQAEVLDLAAHTGNPRLVLRNGGDDESAQSRGVTLAELRGVEERPAAPKAVTMSPGDDPAGRLVGDATARRSPPASADAPAFRDVEVIRGGAASTVKVPLGPGGAAPERTQPRTPAGPVTAGSGQPDDVVPAR